MAPFAWERTRGKSRKGAQLFRSKAAGGTFKHLCVSAGTRRLYWQPQFSSPVEFRLSLHHPVWLWLLQASEQKKLGSACAIHHSRQQTRQGKSPSTLAWCPTTDTFQNWSRCYGFSGSSNILQNWKCTCDDAGSALNLPSTPLATHGSWWYITRGTLGQAHPKNWPPPMISRSPLERNAR